MWDYDRQVHEQRRQEYWDFFWKHQGDYGPDRPGLIVGFLKMAVAPAG